MHIPTSNYHNKLHNELYYKYNFNLLLLIYDEINTNL